MAPPEQECVFAQDELRQLAVEPPLEQLLLPLVPTVSRQVLQATLVLLG